MAHYAKVVYPEGSDLGDVKKVLVAEAEFFDTYMDDSPGEWIKTSFNTRHGQYWNSDTGELHDDQSKAFRKNYASIGGWYDRVRDAFYVKQPYPSWTLNETTCCWEPPVAKPDESDARNIKWDEDVYNADNSEGWVAQ